MLDATPIPMARPLSSPRIYLIRMAVFLILVGFIALILSRQLIAAFLGNPGLNGLILGVLLVGIVLAVRQIVRLFREIRWVNHLSGGEGTSARPPTLLAPMASLISDAPSRASLTVATTRTLLDSVAARLDENRELVRYLAGLLVFLGLLGTFWGLIDTVNSVGRIIGSLRTGAEAAVLFDELKSSLAAPLSGMGVSFSASLFGLAGSLVLGFLDLQGGQAQSRFYTELEDWLALGARPDLHLQDVSAAAGPSGSPEVVAALERLTEALNEGANGQTATQSLANLAEGIQGLVQHMRSEQQLIRDWVEAQAGREKEVKALLERLSRERIG